jgi:hypothetical protein
LILGIFFVKMWTGLYLKTDVFKVIAISTSYPIWIVFAGKKYLGGFCDKSFSPSGCKSCCLLSK